MLREHCFFPSSGRWLAPGGFSSFRVTSMILRTDCQGVEASWDVAEAVRSLQPQWSRLVLVTLEQRMGLR